MDYNDLPYTKEIKKIESLIDVNKDNIEYYNKFISTAMNLGYYEIAVAYMYELPNLDQDIIINILDQNNPHFTIEVLKLDSFSMLLREYEGYKVRLALYRSVSAIINSLPSDKSNYMYLKNLSNLLNKIKPEEPNKSSIDLNSSL